MKTAATTYMETMKCTDKELIEALRASNAEKQELIEILCCRLARFQDQQRSLTLPPEIFIAKE